MSRYVRARPPPQSLEEALEIAAPLADDIRLRAEEMEAIEWLVRYARANRPSKRWVGNAPVDPTAEDT